MTNVGERVAMVILSRYSGCRQRGGSGGGVRMSVGALIVEFRPSARSVKVVVGVGTTKEEGRANQTNSLLT